MNGWRRGRASLSALRQITISLYPAFLAGYFLLTRDAPLVYSDVRNLTKEYFVREITEVVLTGGPCSGKSSARSYFQSWLLDRGFRPFFIPEVATMIIQGGVYDIGKIAGDNHRLFLSIQREILKMQRALRDRFSLLARCFPERAVLISDRAEMDGAAYVPRSEFEALLDEEHLGLNDVRDSYNLVIHLVTAANGAEDHYTTANNTARRESPIEARELDQKTQEAWSGCPNWRAVDNSTDFEGKMSRAIKVLAQILGLPIPIDIERKFLIRHMPNLSLIPGIQQSFIQQAYLKSSSANEQVRIRRRVAKDGSAIHSHTVKMLTGSAETRLKRERRLTALEYLELLKLIDPETSWIWKNRYSFMYHSQYFDLDVFNNGLVLLEVHLTEANDDIMLPPFLRIACEVTGDPRYSNYSLSREMLPF